jgi:predicted permease
MNPNLVFLLSLFFVFVGYILKKIGLFGESESRSISRIILNVTLPALIIRTIIGADISWSLIYLPISAVAYGIIVCGILLFFNRRKPPEDKAIYSMGSIGFNNGMFAYPIIEGIYGNIGLQYLAIFDIGSGLSVFGVSYMLAAYFHAKRTQDQFRMTLGRFLRMILGSIPFVSYILAITLNLTGVRFSPFIDTVFAVPARANMILVLILIGIHLEFNFNGADRRKILQIFGLRYGLGILLGAIVFFLPISPVALKGVFTLVFILPVSMAMLPYSSKFGFDIKTAGALVNYSIIISFILMWIVINIIPIV